MDFKHIPASAQPAYTWLWNSTITKEGIAQQIDEMYDAGIRAFYIIGEPKNFRPTARRTHLSPEYLSDAYLDLLFYAFETAKKKGMYTWLYNEGGFPSGMVCGKIRQDHPELAMQMLESVSIVLAPDSQYSPHERAIAAFANSTKIQSGASFKEETTVTEYRWFHASDPTTVIRTDNASLRNTELFLELTHEALRKRFGAHMGTDITLMFDDEAHMGQWTDGFDRIFYNRYGYDITDYLPYISGALTPDAEEQYRAKSDYLMLCGELVRNHYFAPMREWLRRHNMISTGHLDNDHRVDGTVINRYGNALATLRTFDVPGIDVIWSQIAYPQNGKSVSEGMAFFPRFASSAARQLGHNTCVSESFAVYGAHIDPELMRYGVNYQAVRGISLFNFMVISYDRATPMMHQYRPNFIPENPSMDRLSEINTYTARLSHLLQSSKADIEAALYVPYRSICAGGAKGQSAMDSFEALGHRLEEAGVAFDLIDEELVRTATAGNGQLVCDHVRYRHIFVPTSDFEPIEVLEKMAMTDADMIPCIKRTNPFLQARKVLFPDGSEGYFLCNTDGKTVSDIVEIDSDKAVYEIDLHDGTIYHITHTCKDGICSIPVTLHRGEGIFLLLCDNQQDAKHRPNTKFVAALSDFTAQITRTYRLDAEKGTCNDRTVRPLPNGLGAWENNFSGEVTYTCRLAKLPDGNLLLDLGEVRCTAEVWLDDRRCGISTMPPYRIPLGAVKEGSTLRVVVANTAANACVHTDYFDRHDPRDVGPYHAKMVRAEAKTAPGGWFGPAVILQYD